MFQFAGLRFGQSLDPSRERLEVQQQHQPRMQTGQTLQSLQVVAVGLELPDEPARR